MHSNFLATEMDIERIMRLIASSVQTRIETAERKRLAAMIGGDLDALKGILSDDLLYGHSSGKIDTKADFINMISDGTLKYVGIDSNLDNFLALGADIYLASGWLTTKALYLGEDKNLSGRYLSVWKITDSRVQLVALQASNN